MLSFIEKKKKGRFFPNLSGRRRNKYQFGRAFTPGSENVYSIFIYISPYWLVLYWVHMMEICTKCNNCASKGTLPKLIWISAHKNQACQGYRCKCTYTYSICLLKIADKYRCSCTLYLSRHFILVAIICANQSESKFLSLPHKSGQNVSQGNQLFNLNKNKGKHQITRQPYFFPC